MERTNIPVSKKTRRELRILKAEEGRRSYDDVIHRLLDEHDPNGGGEGR